MIFQNPGTDRIPLFGGCKPPGQYEILIAPSSGTFRGADGRVPHLLYQFSGAGRDAEFQLTGKEILGSVTGADKTFTVEFDAGGFSINTMGSLFLTGGDPSGRCRVELFHHLLVKPVLSWHWLTTRLLTEQSTTIPDYHTAVCGWVRAAGATLEGFAIDLSAYPVPCIPGTALTNGRGVTIMTATGWWG